MAERKQRAKPPTKRKGVKRERSTRASDHGGPRANSGRKAELSLTDKQDIGGWCEAEFRRRHKQKFEQRKQQILDEIGYTAHQEELATLVEVHLNSFLKKKLRGERVSATEFDKLLAEGRRDWLATDEARRLVSRPRDGWEPASNSSAIVPRDDGPWIDGEITQNARDAARELGKIKLARLKGIRECIIQDALKKYRPNHSQLTRSAVDRAWKDWRLFEKSLRDGQT